MRKLLVIIQFFSLTFMAETAFGNNPFQIPIAKCTFENALEPAPSFLILYGNHDLTEGSMLLGGEEERLVLNLKLITNLTPDGQKTIKRVYSSFLAPTSNREDPAYLPGELTIERNHAGGARGEIRISSWFRLITTSCEFLNF